MKVYQANGHQKQAEVSKLISDKVYFNPKLVRRDKGHFILIKNVIYQEEITIINLHISNVSASNIIKNTVVDLNHR
jgi:hypothetical protein